MLYLKNSFFKTRLKVACILDDFSYQCFKDECDLITFEPDNWQSVMLENKPNMLLVESAWKGNNGAWQYKIGKYFNQSKDELIQLLKWCREHKIPSVFWNKEDPVHFDKFIDTVQLFDFVFTTDGNSIEKYIRILGHKNVDILTFAAQPKIHNPIKEMPHKHEKLCFTGSYYANRHEARKKDLEDLLDVAREYGLAIYDRNYIGSEETVNKAFRYPERFQPYIIGSLPYNEITKVYKSYKIMLNVNSVKDSPTMFSRRVFEILACGTPVISTYAQGIENTFGRELVFMGNSKDEYEKAIIKLMSDTQIYERSSIQGVREILKKHTYRHRLVTIAKKIGLQVIDDCQPKVSVLSVVKDQYQLLCTMKNYCRQEYENKELIIIFPHTNMIEKYERHISQVEEGLIKHSVMIKDIKKDVYSQCKGDYISCFDSGNFYGANYLTDLTNGRKYTDCKVIGKSSSFTYNTDSKKLDIVNAANEYSFVSKIKISVCIIEAKLFRNIKLEKIFKCIEDTEIVTQQLNPEQTIFSIDKYNLIKGFYLYPLDAGEEEGLSQKINI